jgi:hypothetical protein
MIRVLMTSVVLLILTAVAVGEDLYLMEIRNESELIKARQIAEYGRGVIDGKFVVYLHRAQAERLRDYNLGLQLLAEDCRLDDFYLVMKDHNREVKAVIDLSPLYSHGFTHLVKLEPSTGDILEREGFWLFPLTEKKTPFFYNRPTRPWSPRVDFPVDSLAEMIDLDSLYSYVTRMEDFYTRFTPTDSNHRARDWLVDKFQSFGYNDIDLQYFLAEREWMEVYDEPAWNVVCYKEGTEQPNQLIVIGGHYDSYSSNSYTYPAPGADDNASGTAAVLELARIFHDLDFRKSLMFVAFGAEEQGLDGARFMAGEMADEGVDIEMMLNFDVISYEDDEIPEFRLTRVMNEQYVQVFADAAGRVNDLIPHIGSGPLSSDDAAFHENGFQSVALYEYTFHPDMHTAWDISGSIDFEYMRKIIQLGAVGIPIIDQAADPTIFSIYDFGDGQSLRVIWEECHGDYGYQIIYGVNQNNLTDTVEVPSGDCYYDISGLTEGTPYYITVIGTPWDGYPALGFYIESATPMIVPRAPSGLTAEPVLNAVDLTWMSNSELDLSHYRILRKEVGLTWQELQGTWSDTSYTDNAIESGREYIYTILAVDADQNESDSSGMVRSFPATFDQGILLAEETQSGGINPTITQQNAFYNAILADYTFTRYTIDSAGEPLTRSMAGQYNPVFYVDDDDLLHHFEYSVDTLKWYLSFPTNLFVAGWGTIYSVTGQSYFYDGNFFHDELGLAYVGRNIVQDFIGATGEGDWPDLVLKPEAPYGGRLPDIEIFDSAAGAEVIARFNSHSGNPFYDGRPVGIAYDTYDGKRVVLGCPLYWLTEASAQALIQRVMEYFAAPSTDVNGDVNDDHIVNLLDITYLIAYLYQGGPPPVRINNGDPNGDCTINILDVSYLISYLYLSGPAPIDGCVE